MLIHRLLSALRRRSPSDVLGYGWILLRNALGLPNRLGTPDRELLEQTILPHYARQADCQRVLFVGCEWFTRHYEALFPGREYWTMDPDPWKRRFGARRHWVAGLEALGANAPAGHFDLIVCNGVFGWGLNDREACEQAFNDCFRALREGGSFILGWNDVPERRPFNPASLNALARFKPAVFKAFGQARHIADPSTGHVYEFYSKPKAG